MHAMIFAAGLGTRLKPFTESHPKALLPLAGKTLLQWQVEQLRDAGITDIIVNVHHFPDQIIDTVRANDGWGCNILVSDERELLLDTGGGLKKAITTYQLPITGREPVLACNVDILSNIDIRTFVAAYERTGESLLVVSERPTQRYLLFDDDFILRGWTNVATGEVRPSALSIQPSVFRKLAFSGMQILGPDVLKRLDEMEQEKFSLIDFYLHLCETSHQSLLRAFVPENYTMMDVGKIEQLDAAKRFAEEKI